MDFNNLWALIRADNAANGRVEYMDGGQHNKQSFFLCRLFVIKQGLTGYLSENGEFIDHISIDININKGVYDKKYRIIKAG